MSVQSFEVSALQVEERVTSVGLALQLSSDLSLPRRHDVR
jgi:hypothetical protein